MIRGDIASLAEAGVRRQEVQHEFVDLQRFGGVIQDLLRQLDPEADAAGQGAGLDAGPSESLVAAQVSQQGDGCGHHEQGRQEDGPFLSVHVVLVAKGAGVFGLGSRSQQPNRIRPRKAGT